MTDNEKKMMGQTVYDTICKMFDDMNYHYEKKEAELVINCKVQGDDIPMDIIFVVLADRQIVQLISPMPFRVAEDKRVDVALAATMVNDRLVDGSFDFNLNNGRIAFRLTASYIESILGKELFEYMLMVSATTIDAYNDKFLMIAKGMLSLEQFAEKEAQ